jgi:hypothetical protein
VNQRQGLLIGLVAVIAYVTVLGHGFVYDDSWTIVHNRWLERPFFELLILLSTGDAVVKDIPDATRPAMVVSMWLDRRVFGSSPAGPHLVSLCLYVGTCLLATLVATRLIRKRTPALLAGAFFTLAPLHAEPVAAVNYREDLLSGTGVLLAWLCVLGSADVHQKKVDEWKRAVLGGMAWATALLAKENAVALVPLLGATVWVLPKERRCVRRHTLTLVALFVVGVLWSVWRIRLASMGDDIPRVPARSVVETALRSMRFAVQSVRHSMLPLDWAPDHWRQPEAGMVWTLPFLALVMVAILLAKSRSWRSVALGLWIVLLAALPSSPLVGPVNEVADRYFFLGILGGGMIWGALLQHLSRRLGLSSRRRMLPFLMCLPLLVPTWDASRIWRDELTLWTAAVDRQPNSPRAWAALSRVYRIAGDHDAAVVAVERAIALDPTYPPALVTRVYNEIAAQQLDRARAHIADLERRGLGKQRGIPKARRCLELEAGAVQACLER